MPSGTERIKVGFRLLFFFFEEQGAYYGISKHVTGY